jgi:hypothetical protein
MGDEAYFYEPTAGGHGYGKDNKERASFTALGYNFLRRDIGWGPVRSDRPVIVTTAWLLHAAAGESFS